MPKTPEFLSEAWVAAHAKACPPVDPSVTTVVQHQVSGGPDGNVTYTTTYEDGRAVASTLVPAPAKGDAAPPVAFALSYEDARRIADGDLELGAAFMQGRLKAEGDMQAILALLRAAHPN
jgi:putative sterol carrier protein